MALLVEVHRLDDPLDRRELVARIEDLEALRQRRELPVGAQEAVAQAVEGADPHAAHRNREHRVEPRQHLLGGLVGEGHGQHAAGRELAGLDQPGDPRGQDAGLARAGAGEDERRLGRQGDGGELLGIEAFEQARGTVDDRRDDSLVHSRSATSGPFRRMPPRAPLEAPVFARARHGNLRLRQRPAAAAQVPRREPLRVRPVAGVRAAPLRAAGRSGEHEDRRRRADRRVAGGERLLLRDAPLRRRQRRLREAHARRRTCSSRSARASSRPTTP